MSFPQSKIRSSPCRTGMDVLSHFEPQVGNLGSQGWLVLLKSRKSIARSRPCQWLKSRQDSWRFIFFFGARSKQRPHPCPVPILLLCDSQAPRALWRRRGRQRRHQKEKQAQNKSKDSSMLLSLGLAQVPVSPGSPPSTGTDQNSCPS